LYHRTGSHGRGARSVLDVESKELRPDVEIRVGATLTLIHRWGYAPDVPALAQTLLGGRVSPEEIRSAISQSEEVGVSDGFAYLKGSEDLVARSKRRVASHRALNGKAQSIADEFARDLIALCPFVECVALSGSVASGGYGPSDDIDFDLIVVGDTKYTTYLLATLVGLKYAWRYRTRDVDEIQRTPLLPKVTCVNVVWTDDETRPFRRQDADLAFELLRCRPLYGAEYFRDVLDANPWARTFFPQMFDTSFVDTVARQQSAFIGVLGALGRFPRALRLVEVGSRGLVWMMYHFVQWTRRKNPEAVKRNEFLRRVKFPYEVFQD